MEEDFKQYLKENKGFQRILQAWIQQYCKLARCGGSVCLDTPSTLEKEAIGGFMGVDYRKQKKIKISYAKWQKAIEHSKFEGSDFLRVLELYEGHKLVTNQEIRSHKLAFEQRSFDHLLMTYKDTKVALWLNFVMHEKNKSYTKMKSMIHEGKQKQLHAVLHATNQLPLWKKQSENFAIFATRISGDPHFFDKGNPALLLFESILYFTHIEEDDYTLEEKNKIYYDAGLLKDDLSNNCMICHMNAFDHKQHLHEAWHGFYKNYEPWIVNLYNLQQIEAIDDAIERVYIVENPSVFRTLCIQAKKENIEKAAFICTNGQLNLCAFILLDYINRNAITMYYAGDFDPEGLLIADKLKRKYPHHLRLWHYTKLDYERSTSDKTADERRLSMLQKCECNDLQEVKKCLLEITNCAYQEALLPYYIEDIIEHKKSHTR